jgi:DNA polymerase
VTLRPVVIDFESLFTDQKDERGIPYRFAQRGGPGCNTEDYVRHPWFQAHGAAIKWQANIPARWYPEAELRYVLKNEDWSDVWLIAHHMHFDGLVLSHHYDVHPRMLGCTLACSRLLLGNHLGVGLEAVREHFGMPKKRTPYELFKNKRWQDLTSHEQELLADGCADEVESVWTIFGRLREIGFPSSQYEVVDQMLRMFVEPRLVGDLDKFVSIWNNEATRKHDLLQQLGITASDLQSADRFAALLREQGVEPATKDGKNGDIYAFAKTDPFMEDLLEDEDEVVRALAEARLGVKSTILQTRAETLGWMTRRGPLCVYLRAYGAKTTRPSGGDRSNFLNFKKADPDMPPEKGGTTVKEAICAPPGYLLAPIDCSQLECRFLNMIAGQHDVIDLFRNKKSPYIRVAEQFYGYPITKSTHPTEYQLGKTVELQCGYGSGGEKIRATLRTKAGIIIGPEEGLRARDAYRDTHPAVVDLWKQGGRMLARLAGGDPLAWGPALIKDRRLWLPNGCPLVYDTLEHYKDNEKGESYWRVKTRKGWEKMYGAKFVEHLIQSLAWNFVSDVMVRLARMGYRTLNVPYDELLLLIPKDGHEHEHLEKCKTEMRRPPVWLPEIPLDCEGELSERYA